MWWWVWGFGGLFGRAAGFFIFYQLSCLAGLTGKGRWFAESGREGGCLLWSQSSCTVLPQWLQMKWQIHESLQKMGTGRRPVNAKPFQFTYENLPP